MNSQREIINEERKNKNLFAKRFASLRISKGFMQKDIAQKIRSEQLGRKQMGVRTQNAKI